MTPDQYMRKLRANIRRAWIGGAFFGSMAGWFVSDQMWIPLAFLVFGFLLMRAGIWLGRANSIPAQTVRRRP